MGNIKGIIVFPVLLLVFGCNSYIPKNGEIIFQTSLSSQSRTIQEATHSSV